MATTASVGLAVVLGSTMLYAAASKLATPWNLKKTLDGLGLDAISWPLAGAVIAVEASIGLLTAVAAVVPAVSIAAVTLLALFAAAGVWARLGRLSVSCSCFGVSQSKLGLKTAARAGLLAVGYLAYAALPRDASVEAWAPPTVVLLTLSLGIVAWFRSVSNLARIGV